MGQERLQRNTDKREEVNDEVVPEVEIQDEAEKEIRDKELDALMDEIDLVLEKNAEKFVEGYQQKGGQ